MNKLVTLISGIDKLDENAEQILSKVSNIKYVELESQTELMNALNSCDIFWFRLNHKLTRDVLKNVTCKYILCAVTGLDHIDLEACSDYNIKVISLKGEVEFLKEVRATAEHTFGLLLALIRNTKTAFSHVENGNWNRDLFQGSELYKKTLGIYGLGRLGKIVAEYGKAFGMNICFYDIKEVQHEGYVKCATPQELFTKSDIVTIHLPYNSDTHFIINKSLMSCMKETAYIINTSRGGVINENDLLSSLKENKIAGYATDVLYGEPDIKSNELIHYAAGKSNVIITPHIGGNTAESISKTEIFIAEKLKAALL